PPVRAIVPVSLSSKTMVSAPAWALAWATAARSEPAPLSARVVTWNTAGTMRPSSASRPGRKRSRPNCLRGVRETGRDFFNNRFNQEVAMRKDLQERKHGHRRPRSGGAGTLRMELVSPPHDQMTCSVRNWELAAKLASPL